VWPFKKKRVVKAKAGGVVEQVMYDFIVVGGVRYETKKPLVHLGQRVKKGQPVGKK
jgi:murein DD-endopeptidase MepM/ murein hydrolase activator NlpD